VLVRKIGDRIGEQETLCCIDSQEVSSYHWETSTKHRALISSPQPLGKVEQLGPRARHKSIDSPNWVWWCTPVILAFRRLRQEDHEFKASLG
jgi:hypothetical protein